MKPVVGFAGMTHLGLVSGASVAANGFGTVCYDPDASLIARLSRGDLPILEPGLPALVAANGRRQTFTAHIDDLGRCDVVYISLDVPTNDEGGSELSSINAMIERVVAAMKQDAILVILCQVPPGFTRGLLGIKSSQLYYQVETLVFGRAVERAMHPERTIVGCAEWEKPLDPKYAALLGAFGCPILPMRYESAPRAPQRTVVIGAAGFVGAAVMRRLAAAGASAVSVSRGDVDLLSPDAAMSLAALLRDGDAVVAVAAMAPVRNVDMLVDNMRLTRTILTALRAVKPSHIVNISSDAVYADAPLPLTESSPAAPTSLHGAMHLAREIAFGSEIKCPSATLRPTLIYGASDPHNGYGPNRFRRLAHDGQDIVLFGEGEERRDHVDVDDVAELVWRTLAQRSAGTLNVASGTAHSFRSVADQVVALARNKVAIRSSARVGPMPHGGYRPFDVAATRAAFPNFTYRMLQSGLAKAQADMMEQL